jgi:hypothetical protein
VPSDLQHLFDASPHLSGLVIDRVHPEHKIRFDNIPGEPRNADLAIEAHDPAGVVAITVEGKADESFDQPVEDVLRRAADRVARDEKTGAITRVEGLANSLLRIPRIVISWSAAS